MWSIPLDKKKKFPVGRLMIVFLILGVSAFIYMLSNYRQSKQEGDILGETTPKENLIDKTKVLSEVKNQVEKTVSDLLNRSGSAVKDSATESVGKVKETVIVNTLETVTKQIEKLPVEDQEKVKESICK